MTAPQLQANTSVAGKYTVLSCLGQGGSSATYHAVAADGREVALKIFDPAIRQRADIMTALEQTYAATNALPAEIVVPLLDAGYDPTTGAPFSVTERILFPSLAQLAVQRPLTPEELSNILGYLARAIDMSHSRQLCHHALKPTNIFVGFAQGYGVRVTDFGAGLARAAVPTQEGYMIAAPWLAPEQVQGSVAAGPSADVFAAALVAFWALTGRSYWRSCQGMPDLQAWQQELMGPRPPASARARELGVSLNPSFDPVLGAAIAMDPIQRYRTVGEFASALDALIGGQVSETAATMMYPPNVIGGNDYPPPPPPLGGFSGPGGPTGPTGYPGAAYPPQAPMGVGTGTFPAPAQPGLVTEAEKKPTLELSGARRPASNKLAPVLVAVAGLVLLGGVAGALVWMGSKSPSTDAPATSDSGSATDTAPSAAPSDEPSAGTAATPEPPPSAAPTTVPAATSAELTIICDPECDEVTVDGKKVDASKPIGLLPGKHKVVGSKAGFSSASESITLVAGQPMDRQLKLAAKVATPPPVQPPTATPNPGAGTGTGGGAKPKCGKFIKTNCTK